MILLDIQTKTCIFKLLVKHFYLNFLFETLSLHFVLYFMSILHYESICYSAIIFSELFLRKMEYYVHINPLRIFTAVSLVIKRCKQPNAIH